MLHDVSVLVEAEDVDPRVVTVPWPFLMAMEHNELTFGQRALEVHSLAGVRGAHALEVLDEGLLAVRNAGVVLDLDVANELVDRLPRAAFVEHQVIEGLGVSFVLLWVTAHVCSLLC